STAYGPLRAADRGRPERNTRAHRLCQKAAHFRQHGRGPWDPVGPRASSDRLNHRGPAGGLTPKVSLFDRSTVSSSRPPATTTSRADAVKDGRRFAAASHSACARPSLDGGQYDVMLADRRGPPASTI